MQRFGIPLVVAINHFVTDTDAEIKMIEDNCRALGVNVVIADAWAKGGDGTLDLAKEVVKLADQPSEFHELYTLDQTPEEKIRTIATQVYGAKDVSFSNKAKNSSVNLRNLVGMTFQSALPRRNIHLLTIRTN